jgi:hypothetical protein
LDLESKALALEKFLESNASALDMKGNTVIEFEGQIWAAQDNDDVHFICTTKRIKNKIQVINEKGRD